MTVEGGGAWEAMARGPHPPPRHGEVGSGGRLEAAGHRIGEHELLPIGVEVVEFEVAGGFDLRVGRGVPHLDVVALPDHGAVAIQSGIGTQRGGMVTRPWRSGASSAACPSSARRRLRTLRLEVVALASRAAMRAWKTASG